MTLNELRTGVRVYWWVLKLNLEFLLYDIDDFLMDNIFPFYGRALRARGHAKSPAGKTPPR